MLTVRIGQLTARLDRSRARAAIGGGLPAPPFRLRGGCTFPPWPTFPEAPTVIPDGRISRVRLATMTFIAAFPVPRRLKRSLTYTPSCTGLLSSSIHLRHIPPVQAQCPEWGRLAYPS